MIFFYMWFQPYPKGKNASGGENQSSAELSCISQGLADLWDIKWTRIDPILSNDGFAAVAKKINGDFRLWLTPNELFQSLPRQAEKVCSGGSMRHFTECEGALYRAALRETPGDKEHPETSHSGSYYHPETWRGRGGSSPREFHWELEA